MERRTPHDRAQSGADAQYRDRQGAAAAPDRQRVVAHHHEFASSLKQGARTSEDTSRDAAEHARDQIQEPANEFRIAEGQVTTPDGGGHQGVIVALYRRNQTGDIAPEPITTTSTDVLGDFTLTTPEPTTGTFVIRLSEPHHLDAVREVVIGDDFVPPFFAETLEGNLTLTGRIADAKTQEGIPHADVLLNMYFQHWETKVDDTGRFSIQHVPPGRGEIVINATGYGREVHRMELSGKQGEVAIFLLPERIVRLDIVDESGRPVPEVLVEIYDAPRDDLRAHISDAQGHVTMRGLHAHAEKFTLRLAHDKYVSSVGFDRELELPLDANQSRHKVVMAGAGALSGRITEADSGEPIYGARIRVGGNADIPGPRAWSDSEGAYEIQGVPTGLAVATVHMAGYAPELATARIETGKTTTLDFNLGPGQDLLGLVKTEAGRPVPQMHVSTGLWRGHTTLDLHAFTGPDGRFLIKDVPGDEFDITVRADRGTTAEKTVRPSPGTEVEIVVPDAPKRPTVGGAAPPVKLTALDGRGYDSDTLAGKYVLYDFWATWCGPCLAEMPDLQAVFNEFGSRKDFVLLGVSLDFDEKTLRGYLAKEKIGWPQIYGKTSGAAEAAEKFGVVGIPATFLVGPNGKMIAADFHGKRIRTVVETALNGSATETE